MRTPATAVLAVLAVVMLGACRSEPLAPRVELASALVGSWRGALASPGGELPFGLRIAYGERALEAVILNGEEEAPVSAVELDPERELPVILRFAWYDSKVRAALEEDGRVLRGTWSKTSPGGRSRLAFTAYRDDPERFRGTLEAALLPSHPQAVPSVDGAWAVSFVDDDGTEPARGELAQDGTRVTGTFLTPTGDYRYLEGSYQDGHLRLSTFDGAHAFLFHARARQDGTLAGDFWSRDSYHATWTARPLEAGETVLPDAWSLAALTNDQGLFRFDFPDLDGGRLRHDDPRFAGKVVLVNLFGSWCPNCNDEAPLLADWYRRHRQRGLEIVGLAYEMTGDAARDRGLVARFAERHGIDYPLLLAGTTDKVDAAATLPDLDRVVSYPTTVFIGRDGRVRKIHSGFAGPGTGAHHQALRVELEALLEALLAEDA